MINATLFEVLSFLVDNDGWSTQEEIGERDFSHFDLLELCRLKLALIRPWGNGWEFTYTDAGRDLVVAERDRGLRVKYNVYKVSDGSAVYKCFVLRPDQDEHAHKALEAYAQSCADDNPALACDLRKWLVDIGMTAAKDEQKYFSKGDY